jgi:hypothetical protein
MKQVVQYDLCTFVPVAFTVAFFAHTFTVVHVGGLTVYHGYCMPFSVL